MRAFAQIERLRECAYGLLGSVIVDGTLAYESYVMLRLSQVAVGHVNGWQLRPGKLGPNYYGHWRHRIPDHVLYSARWMLQSQANIWRLAGLFGHGPDLPLVYDYRGRWKLLPCHRTASDAVGCVYSDIEQECGVNV